MNSMNASNLVACLLPAVLISACGGGGSESQADLIAACQSGVQASCNFVESPQGTDLPLKIAPAELSVGDCTTNIPFIFTGGVAPYRVLTTDNSSVPVTSPTPLGDKNFFLASVGPLFGTGRDNPYTAVLTVLDAAGHTATTTLSIGVQSSVCPDNPLLRISPASADARPTEILAFQVSGGNGTISNVSSKDEKVARVLAISGASFQVQAIAAGTTLVTVTSGGQNVNITFTVRP